MSSSASAAMPVVHTPGFLAPPLPVAALPPDKCCVQDLRVFFEGRGPAYLADAVFGTHFDQPPPNGNVHCQDPHVFFVPGDITAQYLTYFLGCVESVIIDDGQHKYCVLRAPEHPFLGPEFVKAANVLATVQTAGDVADDVKGVYPNVRRWCNAESFGLDATTINVDVARATEIHRPGMERSWPWSMAEAPLAKGNFVLVEAKLRRIDPSLGHSPRTYVVRAQRIKVLDILDAESLQGFTEADATHFLSFPTPSPDDGASDGGNITSPGDTPPPSTQLASSSSSRTPKRNPVRTARMRAGPTAPKRIINRSALRATPESPTPSRKRRRRSPDATTTDLTVPQPLTTDPPKGLARRARESP
ncbi:hypothetical protein C8J57DRAFT_1216445 [Mycena rebaudengoi]|nr:hypothetical protein C8J57DRAFT_1216445 [Mycena rebaudengoi]